MTLHSNTFINADRPQLLQHPSVTQLPVEDLGSDLSAKLELSLGVDISNGLACATSARLWESLLETHRLPHLLLRVADMRMTLGSKVTAVDLYEELQALLGDADFADWIARSRSTVLDEAQRQLLIFKDGRSLGFSPSQRWRSTARDPFPYCRLQNSQITAIRDQWKGMGRSDEVMDKFLNYHCLETNVMEGTFQFEEQAALDLIRLGFHDPASSVNSRNIIGGEVRNIAEALAILQDTRKTWDETFAFLDADPPNLTMEVICRLHAHLMQTSRVLYIDTGFGFQFSYVNIGVTRQESQVNVTATSTSMGQCVKVQFCPYDEIEGELNTFCDRFNELMREPNADPFASAAWICHVFVTIHPFEDGNGRLSRILASIPLLRNGLPPLCIQASRKLAYIAHHGSVRADRNGDYQMLMEMLYNSTKKSMDALVAMKVSQAAD